MLFLQGGAIGENAIVPMNLLGGGRDGADFVNTGEWSKKSIKEAKKYAQVNVAASSRGQHFTYVPPQRPWRLSRDAAYVHVCTNETIGGVEYHWTPDVGRRRWSPTCPRTSCRGRSTSRKYGVIYGGAQKNVGPAGLTIVIVRKDLLDRALPITPSAFHWKEQAEADSMLNTPPTYVDLHRRAGVRVAAGAGRPGRDRAEEHREGRSCCTTTLDASGFYANPVARKTARA